VNYPYYQVARFAAPNLIVATPSYSSTQKTARLGLAIAQDLKDAGVPDGVYVNLFATHEQVAAMIADPRLRGVSLTGSERPAPAVAETAGRNLKKVVLELGRLRPVHHPRHRRRRGRGKTAWVTRMENVGQACNSNKRMIVMDDIYDDFVAALVKRATTMSRVSRAMTPRAPTARWSPVRPAENLLAQVQDRGIEGRDAARRRHAR